MPYFVDALTQAGIWNATQASDSETESKHNTQYQTSPTPTALKYKSALKFQKKSTRLKILNHPQLDNSHVLECYGGEGHVGSLYHDKFKLHTIIEKDQQHEAKLKEKFPNARIHIQDNATFDYSSLSPAPTFVDFDAYGDPYALIEKYFDTAKTPPKFFALTDGKFLNMKLVAQDPAERLKWLEKYDYPIPANIKNRTSYTVLIKQSVELKIKKLLSDKIEILNSTVEQSNVYLSARVLT